jgi:GWxTD domain-containing protein
VNGERIFAAVLLALVTASAIAQAGPQQAAAKASVSDVYQQWVEEDVAYIITPEQRAQFLKLSGDKEREEFVIQFWQKRDPTPHTKENEFKEEHYRRLAYSNEHFAYLRPGWTTDRGRVYITEGPPTEVIQVPFKMDGGPDHKTQLWQYDSGKKFTFVDACDCGEYRLTLVP